MVVGNPPYVRVQLIPQNHANFYYSNYEVSTGKIDISILFFELANETSNQGILASIYELSNRTVFVKLSIEQSALIEVKKDFLTFSKSISL